MKHNELINLWKHALDSPCGIEVSCDDRILLRQQLYRARAAEPTDVFDKLQIAMTTDESVLLIVTRGDLGNGKA